MKNLITRATILCTLLLGTSARAQGNPQLAEGYHSPEALYFLNWEITKPVGDFSKYIDATSLLGFSFEGRHFVRDNFSVGLSFSWNRHYQTKDMVNVQINDTTAVSGSVYRDAEMFAVRALGHFYLMNGPLRPYVGLGIGGSWDYAYQQAADLSRSQQNFDFIIDPEVGLLFNFGGGFSSVGLNAAIRYTYTTATVGSYHNAQSYAAILGLSFGY